MDPTKEPFSGQAPTTKTLDGAAVATLSPTEAPLETDTVSSKPEADSNSKGLLHAAKKLFMFEKDPYSNSEKTPVSPISNTQAVPITPEAVATDQHYSEWQHQDVSQAPDMPKATPTTIPLTEPIPQPESTPEPIPAIEPMQSSTPADEQSFSKSSSIAEQPTNQPPVVETPIVSVDPLPSITPDSTNISSVTENKETLKPQIQMPESIATSTTETPQATNPNPFPSPEPVQTPMANTELPISEPIANPAIDPIPAPQPNIMSSELPITQPVVKQTNENAPFPSAPDLNGNSTSADLTPPTVPPSEVKINYS